jgi:adenylosuccinate synthase
MFGPSCRCVVVVGAQWGDEGKGKIVDVLSERADLVIRYQGGANAGHTVVRGEDQFILHQVPSGILHQNTRCLIGNGVVVDPETLLDEVRQLEARGITVRDRLTISDRAHLVLPYHKMIDRAAERLQRIGTTGRGIGPAYEAKYGRRGLRVGQLRDLSDASQRVRVSVERANALLREMGAEEEANPIEHMALLRRVAEAISPLIGDTGRLAHEAHHAGHHLLLEGAQGALLDVDHGTYPYVTSSNTTAGAAAVGVGIGPTAIDAVLGVVKAYTTRVGNGPLPTEANDEFGELLRRIGGEFGATTGRPRRCGWFDAVVVRYAARVNGLTDLAVTKLDVLDQISSIPICVRYSLEGEEFDDVPAEASLLDRVQPVYERLDGWCRPTTDARTIEDLPRQARAYLDRLENMLATPIAYVSVGSRRDQLVGWSGR